MAQINNPPPNTPWVKDLYSINTPTDELNYYEKTAADYESTLKGLHYAAPNYCFEVLKNCEHKFGFHVPRDGKFMDIGAGTGMTGECLRSAGFTGEVDALEPSDNMYELAKGKGIYTNRYSDLLLADKPTSVASDSYDLVFSSGVFNNRSATPDCLPEAVRMAKRGGIIATAMNYNYWPNFMEVAVKDLADKKVVELKHVESREGYYDGKTCCIFIMLKL